MELAVQIAKGLEAAHDRGIVHRDLKPANIMITSAGSVKILDFGLARLVRGEAASLIANAVTTELKTAQGVLTGTPAYMSPEQVRCEAVDRQTDVWAFGCVLYEMVAGRSPFARPTFSDTLVAVLDATPDWNALPPRTPA